MRLDYDIVCFSQQRWALAQRPERLLRRCSRERRVFFVEAPVYDEGPPRLEIDERAGVRVCVPALPPDVSQAGAERLQSAMLGELMRASGVREHVAWYFAPAALAFTEALRPLVTVYDCAGDVSAAPGAAPWLATLERELLWRADLVFTTGRSLCEAKSALHPNVHAFPNAVDIKHFARARARQADPDDQVPFPRPRLGFFGTIDGRVDLGLLEGVARARPAWQIILIGPEAEADRPSLPRAPNLHYLGPKGYFDLPRYLAGWDVAIAPYVKNESTSFLSATKALEFLAAGRPVVSTSIRDIARPYGAEGLVRIADGVEAFVAACEAALDEADRGGWLVKVDAALSRLSWGHTWDAMTRLIDGVAAERLGLAKAAPSPAAAAKGAE